MIPYLFNKFQRSKWEGLGNLKLRLHKDMTTFQTLQTWIGHVPMFESFAISFSNLIFSHFKHATTHYQTLQTWIGLNVIRYHNLSALPHALPWILSQISLVLGYFQYVNTRYHNFLKENINIYFFINLTVTRG